MSDVIRPWFRRQSFGLAPNQTPKWHYAEDVKKLGHPLYDNVQVTALCGYTYTFRWFSDMMRREDVKTAKIRCAKCEGLLTRPVTSRPVLVVEEGS